MSTSKPTATTERTVRTRAAKILRPLLVFVLVLRCAAALPAHRVSGPVDPHGPLGRILATTPVQTAAQ